MDWKPGALLGGVGTCSPYGLTAASVAAPHLPSGAVPAGRLTGVFVMPPK